MYKCVCVTERECVFVCIMYSINHIHTCIKKSVSGCESVCVPLCCEWGERR